ncbi:MAG: prepilin-type N-terminal cleavage/methylation domain-containing protein [Maricaulaceae bacterium]
MKRAGFTLLEALIALALLGLLTATVAGAVRLGDRAFRAANAQSERIADRAAFERAVRAQLEQALALDTVAVDAARRGVFFDGAADRLAFAAPAPGGGLRGGVYRHDFALEAFEGAQRLVLTVAPIAQNRAPARTPLSGPLTALDIAYFGDPTGAGTPAWRTDWRNAEQGPALIALTATYPDGDTVSLGVRPPAFETAVPGL